MIVHSDREHLLSLTSDEVINHLESNKIICELCGVKPAKRLLKLSLQFCCVSDGRKCRKPIPLDSLCPYCARSAAIKLDSGLVCSKSCPELAARKSELIKEERKKRFSDPEYTKAFLENRKKTTLANYGVEHTSNLPEVKGKISASGKIAHANLPVDAKQRIEEARLSDNRQDRRPLTIRESLSLLERQKINMLTQSEQRKGMSSRSVVCEVCKTRRGLYILDNSLTVCCERRAITCDGTPQEGDVCYGCNQPATTKTKLGFVCGSHPWDGCQKLFDERMVRKTDTFNLRMQDPRLRKQRQTKHEITMLENHGVKSVVSLPSWKASIQEKYGVDNPAQSSVVKKRKITNSLERHGVEHPSMLASTKKAYQKTCQERYGVDNVVQSKELRNVWEATHTEKYGVHHPMMREVNKDIQKLAMAPLREGTWIKIQDTLRREYGATNPANVPGAMDKRAQRFFEKYGVRNVFQLPENKALITLHGWNPETRKRRMETCQEVYGVDHPRKSEIVKEKQVDTCLQRYGVSNPMKDKDVYLHRWLPAMYRTHTLTLPSGRIVSYQGYEHHAIKHLLKSYTEDDLIMNGELSFSYTDPEGDKHTYYPDLGIRSKQTAIEVKSPYTFACSMTDGSLIMKLIATQSHGWLPVVQVWDDDKLLETLLLDDILDNLFYSS